MTLTPTDLRSGSGDQLIIYDTKTNLEWLKLTPTYNHSYIEIQGGFGGFISSLGFRFAKGNEIVKLFKSVGVSKLGGPTPTPDPLNDRAIEALLDMFGGRCLNKTFEYSQGLFDFGCIHTSTAAITAFGLFLNKTASPTNAYADSGYTGILSEFRTDKPIPDVGAYLVRKRAKIPCPATKKHKTKAKRKK